MGRSFLASTLLHLLLAALVVALGAFGRELPPEETPISVEIVSETDLPEPSPLPPKAPPAAAAPKPPQQAATPAPPPPAPKVEVKPEPEPPPPPVKVAERPPEPPKVEPLPPPPEPKKAEPAPSKPELAPKKPEPPPEPPKPVAEKPKPAEPKPADKSVETAKAPPPPKREQPKPPPAPVQAESDFDSLLRSVEQTPKRVKSPDQRDAKGSSAEAGGTGQPGTAKVAQINPTVLAASISRQITPCWNIPVAAQGVGGLRAELNIVMGPDGGIQSVAPTDAARMSRDPVFRAFAESAVRAVRACAPLKLPPESYQVWRNIIFNFDPSRMTG